MDTIEEIESKLRGRVTTVHKSAKLYDEGDHWQDGEGFLPFAYMDAAQKMESKERIRLGFVSENVIGKVNDNEQNGLLGREPDYSAVLPEDAPDAEKDRLEKVQSQIESAIVRYWNERESIKLFREAFRLAAVQEKAVVRAFLPKGYVSQTGQIKTQSELLAAMKMLQFEVLSASVAGVFKDTDFYNDYGVFVKESEGIKKIELTSVDPAGKTRLRIIKQTTGQATAKATLPTLATYIPDDRQSIEDAKPQDLAGQILMFEITRPALIDESIISNQKDVNLGRTMKGRTTYLNGNRAMFTMNAQQPEDENGNPVPIELGGGSVNSLAGIPVWKGEGEQRELVGYANPSVEIIEPIDPENFIKAVEDSAAAIYRQACQEHLTISESASVSGKSKEESRTAFEKKLTDLKPTFDALGRWYLTVLVYFAVANSTEVSIEDLKRFRFDFNCIVDAGTPSIEARNAAAQDVKDGRLSNETYLSKYVGLEDADAEQSRIETSETAQLAAQKLRLEAAQLAKDLGLPADYVVDLLNIENEDEKNKLIAALDVKKTETKVEPVNGNGVAV